MNTSHPLRAAIELITLTALARGLSVTHQAVRKWEVGGRMPRTEWTGETHYSETIESMTNGRVTKAQLLGKWPGHIVAKGAPQAPPARPAAREAA
jgi:hypothetical protein